MIFRKLSKTFDPGSLLGLPGLSWLDSAAQAYGLGRYSILGAQPYQTLVGRGNAIEITRGSAVIKERGDPLAAVSRELGDPIANGSGLPFCGGALGYLSYDFGDVLEPLRGGRKAEPICPDLRFQFYDRGFVIDHHTGESFAVASGRCGRPVEALDELEGWAQVAPRDLASGRSGPLRSNFLREEYLAAVRRIRQLIREGEVYQVNLAQRYTADYEGEAASLYQKLRRANPAPYGAYLDFGDEQVLSSSPERFLTICEGRAETRPIKGTRPRGADAAAEATFRAELARSEKDRSELLMIVDLERNDLGKVCRPGSVRVDGLFQLESYARVIHQTASVSGELEAGRDAFDALRALFPGGSITGAPKIRAREVIEELEPHRRGVYTGCIGYVGFDGRADFNIAIRTMRLAAGQLSFHVGGGVVWDSDPESEYEETLHKARALFDAL